MKDSPITRLGSITEEWKTLVSGILTAGLSVVGATTQFVDAIIKDVPDPWKLSVRWGLIGLLGGLGLWLLYRVWSAHHSRLDDRAREAFRVDSENPAQCVGRKADTEAVAAKCAKFPIVFLQAESGVGKSTLVRQKLIPLLAGSLPHGSAQQPIAPVFVDLRDLPPSGDRSPSSRLTAGLRLALQAVPADLLRKVTDASPPSAEECPFDWINDHVAPTGVRLLLILDQFDDYVLQHRNIFFPVLSDDQTGSARTVVKPATLARKIRAWHRLSALINNQNIHLLLITRSDETRALSAVEFADSERIEVGRVRSASVAGLLADLSNMKVPGTGEPAVIDPEYGWNALNARLLRDLAAGDDTGDKILPMQLDVAVAALASATRFPVLTIARYEKNGGIHGMDSRWLEDHVIYAARLAHLNSSQLYKALNALVDGTGSKTIRASADEICAAASSAGVLLTWKQIEPAFNYFVESRVHVARQLAGVPTHWILYHDYLAPLVREASRRHAALLDHLRDHYQAWHRAGGGWRWSMLLPPVLQLRLICACLFRRLCYLDTREYAIRSTARLLPSIITIGLSVALAVYGIRSYDENLADKIIGLVGNGSTGPNEVTEWKALAKSRQHTRFHTVRLAFQDEDTIERVHEKANVLGHAAAGLDTTASRTLIEDVILRDIEQRPLSYYGISLTIDLLSELDTTDEEYSRFATICLGKIQTGADDGTEFARVVCKMKHPDDALLFGGITALTARMTEDVKKDPELMYLDSSLAKVVDRLKNADATQLTQAAARLSNHMIGKKTNGAALRYLGNALANVAGKMDTPNQTYLIQGIDAIASCMINRNTNNVALSEVLEELRGLMKLLDTSDAKLLSDWGAGIVARMTDKETDNDCLEYLAYALAEVLEKMEQPNTKLLEEACASLVARITSNSTDDMRLFSLGRALYAVASTSGNPDSSLLTQTIAVLAERISSKDTKVGHLRFLCQALADLSSMTDTPDDVMSKAATELVARMSAIPISTGKRASIINYYEDDPQREVAALGFALADICSSRGKSDVNLLRKGASILVSHLASHLRDDDVYGSECAGIGFAIAAVLGAMEPTDASLLRRGATALVTRLTSMRQGESKPIANAFVEVLNKMKKPEQLALLEWEEALVARMVQKDTVPFLLPALTEALAAVAARMERGDSELFKHGAGELMGRIQRENEVKAMSNEIVAWTALDRLEMKSSGREWDRKHAQLYVDLLKQPLVVGAAQKALVDGLGTFAHEEFDSNVWAFVHWATEGVGKKCELDLTR